MKRYQRINQLLGGFSFALQAEIEQELKYRAYTARMHAFFLVCSNLTGDARTKIARLAVQELRPHGREINIAQSIEQQLRDWAI